MFPDWYYQGGSSTFNPQSGAAPSGGLSVGPSLQGSPNTLQVTSSGQDLQPAANPTNAVQKPGVLGATTAVTPTVDPEAQARAAAEAAAAQKAAEEAAKAAALRGEITNIANTIKDIFNSRYGQVEASGQEQVGKLNKRFGTESADITSQVEAENQAIGAAHASGGTFDSSYRGNNVDTVTKAGENQIRDLGTEMQDNIAAIAAWVKQQQTGFDAQKGGIDAIVARLGESTDPAELMQIRSSLEGRIAELNAGNADNNTAAQNADALNKVAPSSVRAQQLKTTISQILQGNADSAQKQAIGQRLISSAGLTPQEEQELTSLLQSGTSEQKKQQA